MRNLSPGTRYENITIFIGNMDALGVCMFSVFVWGSTCLRSRVYFIGCR